MDASTIMPMPSAKPPSDMMFSDTPYSCIGAKVTMTEMGIDSAITKVGAKRRSANQITNTVNRPPIQAESCTSLMESRMKVD